MPEDNVSYETNLVRLWLLNDEWLFRTSEELATEALEQAAEKEDTAVAARAQAIDTLKEGLHDLVRDQAPAVEGVWNDLINLALRSIDFEMLAEDWLFDRPLWELQMLDPSGEVVDFPKAYTHKESALAELSDMVAVEDPQVGTPYPCEAGFQAVVVEVQA